MISRNKIFPADPWVLGPVLGLILDSIVEETGVPDSGFLLNLNLILCFAKLGWLASVEFSLAGLDR